MSDYGNTEHILLDDSLDPDVRTVARSLIEHGLGRGVSLFDPSRSVWSADTVDALYRCYNEQLDFGTGSFIDKLRRQLSDASDDVILLTAELLTLHALPLDNFSEAKKLDRIESILSWMRNPGSIPVEVRTAFGQGNWSGGVGVHTMVWKWLADAVVLVQKWWELPEPQRSRALDDPWTWQEVIHGFPGMPSLRESVLYLAFPGYFLPIINLTHKRHIRSAFSYRLDHPTGNLDHDLYEITIAVQRDFGGTVSYYRPPFVNDWRPVDERPGEQRAWLVRPTPGGRERAEQWKREGLVSLAASHLAVADPGASLSAIRQAVETGYQHLDYAQRATLAAEYHAFLSRMAEDHIVATLEENRLDVGVITGPPVYDLAAMDTELRRAVTWQEAAPVAVADLPEELANALDQQGTIIDVTGAYEYLSRLIGVEDGPGPKPPPPPFTLKPATPELAKSLHMPQLWLQDIIDVLQSRKQIVFYGPPGTGKTYIAQALADHIAGTGTGATSLVQFHPSYAYEDFFEGYRPAGEDDKAAFKLTSGPLRRIAAAAKKDPENPYVLIIDEINRANLAKVFGELYFLLEYRKKRIRLQYSPDEQFALPPNVYLIGTMNTADRSIALVDAAIRRRFAFIELHPDEPPIRDLLAAWLQDQNASSTERIGLLATLNASLPDTDRDFKIGPSYFMRPEADTEAGLDRIWRYDLLPLLEEHFYGRLSRSEIVRRFGLDAIRTRIAGARP